jgi:hypothetical protein
MFYLANIANDRDTQQHTVMAPNFFLRSDRLVLGQCSGDYYVISDGL